MNRKNVLILSGDHIPNGLSKRCSTNILTVMPMSRLPFSSMSVLKKAKRFGIMNVDKKGSYHRFEEKARKTKSTLASMGIYIFKGTKLLKQFLIKERR